MTAEFIAAQRTDHGVPHAVACRALGVPESTFHKHHNRVIPPRRICRCQATDAEVNRAFDRSRGIYGSPRARALLRRDGLSVSKKTVEASIARQGLCARPNKTKGMSRPEPRRSRHLRICWGAISARRATPRNGAATSKKSKPTRTRCSSRSVLDLVLDGASTASPPLTTTRPPS